MANLANIRPAGVSPSQITAFRAAVGIGSRGGNARTSSTQREGAFSSRSRAGRRQDAINAGRRLRPGD